MNSYSTLLGRILVFLAFTSTSGFAADSKKTGPKKDDFTVASSTKLDFDETLIEGKMQAPNGFFLQGRTPQALSQMVKLRSNFRPELRNSKSGVRSLTR